VVGFGKKFPVVSIRMLLNPSPFVRVLRTTMPTDTSFRSKLVARLTVQTAAVVLGIAVTIGTMIWNASSVNSAVDSLQESAVTQSRINEDQTKINTQTLLLLTSLQNQVAIQQRVLEACCIRYTTPRQ
jgi:hypothetical protein